MQVRDTGYDETIGEWGETDRVRELSGRSEHNMED